MKRQLPSSEELEFAEEPNCRSISAANFLVLCENCRSERHLLFTGNGEYDKGDEEAVGTASPFPKPGDLNS